MSVLQCPECGGKVSTKADKCPHCGAPPPADARQPIKNQHGNWDALREWYEREIDPTRSQPETRSHSEIKRVSRTKDFGRLLVAAIGVWVVILVVIAVISGSDDKPAQSATAANQSTTAPRSQYTRKEYLAARKAAQIFLDQLAPALRGLSGSDFRSVGAVGGWDCSDQSMADSRAQCVLREPVTVWLEGIYKRGTRRVVTVGLTIADPAGEAFEDLLRERFGEPKAGKGEGVSVWTLRKNTAVSYHEYRNIHYMRYGSARSPDVVGAPE